MAVVTDETMPAMRLTVLGCSGSYGAPRGEACSGYLVEAGGTTLWVDCGNGTLVNLQRYIEPRAIDAVVITHVHPDHCVDIFGLHVLNKYGIERANLPVYAPAGLERTLAACVGGGWGGAFDWRTVGDGDTATQGDVRLAFSRTDHPVPTVAVELERRGRRLVYTSDTGPGWSPAAFARRADLVLSEATYLHDDIRAPIHLSARQAGELAREAEAQRLVLTHLWPMCDAARSQAEGSDGFGGDVAVARAHDTYTI